jgi:hypothetical protein
MLGVSHALTRITTSATVAMHAIVSILTASKLRVTFSDKLADTK